MTGNFERLHVCGGCGGLEVLTMSEAKVLVCLFAAPEELDAYTIERVTGVASRTVKRVFSDWPRLFSRRKTGGRSVASLTVDGIRIARGMVRGAPKETGGTSFFPEFGTSPRDSEHLEALRECIDACGIWPSLEAADRGEYESCVRHMSALILASGAPVKRDELEKAAQLEHLENCAAQARAFEMELIETHGTQGVTL